MSDYKPNSHKYREGQKNPEAGKREVKPVIKGTAKIKKKSEIRKFADVFVAEDASNVKSYIMDNMVIPGVKKLLVGIISTAAEMFFGEQGYRNPHDGRRGSYVAYGDRYGRRDERPVSAARPRFDYNDIIFESRPEAEAVLRAMDGSIRDYGYVSIADMYDMADLTAPPFTSVKYGWTDLRDAHIVRTFDGAYLIKLPKAEQLD